MKTSFALVILVVFSLACDRKVPDDHTSLAVSPGEDPGKPAKKLNLVWLHHSTGDELLKGGLRAALDQNNINFFDINYKEAKVDDYVIGDHTDPKDFPTNFNNEKYFSVIRSWELKGDGKKHDVVMFKSCFPASDIKSDSQFEAYKKYYLSLLPTIKSNPEILFVGMSTPPLMKKETKAEHAKRARKWAKWITTEYPKMAPNVKIFDLFNALAIREGKPNENTLAPQFGTDKYDSHPSPSGAKAATRLFIPWLNRTLKDAGLNK